MSQPSGAGSGSPLAASHYRMGFSTPGAIRQISLKASRQTLVDVDMAASAVRKEDSATLLVWPGRREGKDVWCGGEGVRRHVGGMLLCSFVQHIRR